MTVAEAPGSGALDELARLDSIARRLRCECPWDREQDARSIVPHTVEEAYELADAARTGDAAKMVDELGDVLFQVVFLALLLEERAEGDLGAVARSCSEKLVRRHPHVFGEGQADSSDEVLANWDRIKRDQEGRGREIFAEVPENLPALLYARKLQRRADSRRDAPATDHLAALDRLRDELAGLTRAAPAGASAAPTADPGIREALDAAVGDLLFAAVDAARALRVDPELALRAACSRFRRQIEQ